MMRAMHAVKLIEKKINQELINLLGLEETLDRLVTASGMRWYGQVLEMMRCQYERWILKWVGEGVGDRRWHEQGRWLNMWKSSE